MYIWNGDEEEEFRRHQETAAELERLREELFRAHYAARVKVPDVRWLGVLLLAAGFVWGLAIGALLAG